MARIATLCLKINTRRLHILAFVLQKKKKKKAAASASSPANCPHPPSPQKNLAAHQEKATKRRTRVITGIVACRFMLLKA